MIGRSAMPSSCGGRLGTDGAIGDYVAKPKWMRWAPFGRKMNRIEKAEGVCNAYLMVFVRKLGGRI